MMSVEQMEENIQAIVGNNILLLFITISILIQLTRFEKTIT